MFFAVQRAICFTVLTSNVLSIRQDSNLRLAKGAID